MSESTYMEISSTRAINNELFSQGIIDFPYSIGNPVCWIPSRSYMRITLQLLKSAGVVPKISDMISYENSARKAFYN